MAFSLRKLANSLPFSGVLRLRLLIKAINLFLTKKFVTRYFKAEERETEFILLRNLEQDMETVIKALQPGPLGIIEHKFSTEEIQKANATVKRAVENWRRNAKAEQQNPILRDFISK